MELCIWKKDFKNYMDFVYNNRRYPVSKTTDMEEIYLFNWAKKQRCMYSKKKLNDDKINLLNDFKFWYFKTNEKEKNMNKIKIFFESNENISNIIENKVNNNYVNNNIVINIEKLNIYYEKQDEKKPSYYTLITNKIYSYLNIFRKNNLLLDNV